MSIYLQLQVGIYYKPIFLFCVVMQKKKIYSVHTKFQLLRLTWYTADIVCSRSGSANTNFFYKYIQYFLHLAKTQLSKPHI